MLGPSKRISPSWRDAAASHGFGVHCVRLPDGERFTFLLTDTAKIRELGFRATEALVSESDLRAQLVQAGFQKADIDAAIQTARAWTTTVTRISD